MADSALSTLCRPAQVEHDLQVRQHHPIAALHGEMHLPGHRTHIHSPHLGVFVKAVAGNRAGHAARRISRTAGLSIGTQDRRTVERHAVQESPQRRLLQLAEVVPIGLHVVGVDVGHHRHHRQQVQERRIRLIRLHHDIARRYPDLALAPALLRRPPITKVGSSPASASTLATKLVVVVFPWVPAMAMPCLRRMSSASISARGTTGNASSRGRGHALRGCRPCTAVDVTTASAPSTCARPHGPGRYVVMPRACQRWRKVALSARSEPEMTVAQVAQHLGNPGHAGAAHEADEMNVATGVFHGVASSSQAATTAHPWRVVVCIFLAPSGPLHQRRALCF